MRSIRPATCRRFSSSATSAGEMLIRARATTTPLPNLPEAVRPSTLDEAYDVQRAGWDATLAQFPDTRRIGYKVAATSDMAQASVNMTHPFAGALWSHSTFGYDASCDATLSAADSFHGAPGNGVKGERLTGQTAQDHRRWFISAASLGEFRLVEPEFALELHADIPAGIDHTRDSVAFAVGGVLPCIELVGSGFDLGSDENTAAQLAGFKSLGAPSLIADNASHGAWIVGARRRPGSWWERAGAVCRATGRAPTVKISAEEAGYALDSVMYAVGAAASETNMPVRTMLNYDAGTMPTMQSENGVHLEADEFKALIDGLDTHRCELFLNDELVAEGEGAAVISHPLNSLAWLANHLGAQGVGLKAGEVVTTGVVVDGLVNAKVGDVIRADFGAIGVVELEFK